MAQGNGPHLKCLVFVQQLMLTCVNLVPLHFVRKRRIEIFEMISQYLIKRFRCIDGEWGAASHQTHGRDQSEKSIYVISMQMRNEDSLQLQWIDAEFA